MNTFFGIYDRTGRPVPAEVADLMYGSSSTYEHEAGGVCIAGEVAFGFRTHPGSMRSYFGTEPLKKSIDGHPCTIVGDVRLDNRDELCRRLGLIDTGRLTDEEILLQAYGRWGTECPKYLLGDFAFVIRDGYLRRFVCVTDHSGIEPFYYHLSGDLFVFGNDLRTIARHPDISKRFNDEAVAIYLDKATFKHPTFTMFEQIGKLPPASVLVVTSTQATCSTYWDPENAPDIRYASMDDYADHLAALLSDVVNVRVGDDHPVASHLSGGLDSSSIAVLAKRELEKRGRKLNVFNWIHPEETEEQRRHYEFANSRSICVREGLEERRLSMDAGAFEASLLSTDIANNELTMTCYESYLIRIFSRENIRTVLSGWGGDELISYNGRILAGLRNGRPAREWYVVLLGRLKKRLFRYFRTAARPTPGDLSKMRWKYADRNFAERYREKTARYNPIETQDPLSLYRAGHLNTRIYSWDALARPFGIDYRYPLLDKRIVEFALGVPVELYRMNDIPRYFYRQATAGILPDPVRRHRQKREDYRVERTKKRLQEALPRLLEESASMARSEYIDISLVSQVRDLDRMSIRELMILKRSYLLARMGHRFMHSGI